MRSSFKSEVSVEEVCRRYLAGESIRQLEEAFRVCSWTICDRLRKGGVVSRTNTINAGITSEMETGMVASYVGGKGSTAVAKEFKVSQMAVYGALSRAGVDLRENKYPTYSINEKFWDADTEGMKYWLGFSMADGSVADRGKRGLAFKLSVSECDGSHIEKFKNATSSSYPVVAQKLDKNPRSGSKAMVSTSVFSRAFCEGGIRVGIVPRKTYSADVSSDYWNDVSFWRGAVDGDGSVGIVKNKTGRPLITFVGHLGSKLPVRFADFADSLGLRAQRSVCGPKKQAHHMSISGANAVVLARILYQDAPEHLRLDRKYESWKKIEELVQEKARNCSAAVQIAAYGRFWTDEQIAAARQRVRDVYADDSRAKPPSRKGWKNNKPPEAA